MLVSMGFVFFSYLLGSLSTAIITCKLMGLADPRTQGSSNPGATNVYQLFGKTPAIITLIGDLLKGLIPVLLASYYGFDITTLSLVALAAFLGHLYPLFFRFEGGKGVATALGVILGLNPLVGLFVVLTWILVLKLFKLSSLAALVTATVTPLYFYFVDTPYVYMSFVMSIFLIWRHRSNIKKILDGTED